MKKLNESELEELESIKFYVKYILTKPNPEEWEIHEGMKKLMEIEEKYDLQNTENEEINKILDIHDLKDYAELFFKILRKKLDNLNI